MKPFRAIPSLFIIFFITLIMSASLSAVTRGVHVVSREGQKLYLYKDYYALVAGVGDYDYWPDLQGAVKDAKDVADVLKKLGMQVQLLLNPSSSELKKAMDNLAYRIGAEKNRAIMFYFSGHGETETLATGEKLGYIVLKDSPLRSRDRVGFINKSISMNQIETYALLIQSKHALMVFDSCFSGSVFSSVKGVPTDISEKSNRPVRQFIAAGNENEQVPDESIFKTCFMQGIQGEADANCDGYVTGSELGMYLDSSVVNYSKGAQHPQYGKIRHPKLDKGDFIIKLDLADLEAVPEKSAKPVRATTLSVRSNITGAKIYVDNYEVGRSSISNIELSPGKHAIKVEKDGYKPYKKSIYLQQGRSIELAAYLKKLLPVVKKLPVKKKALVEKEAPLKKIIPAPETFTNFLGMKFVKIPEGTFMMGSPLSEPRRFSNEKQRRVAISRPFYLQTTEVTQGEWKKIMGENPSCFKDCGDQHPVERVSWNECQEFIQRLNKKEGANKYRLPTEAEWEYACRAGTPTPFHTGKCISAGQANYNGVYPMPKCKRGKYRGKTLKVGSFSPNPRGLYNMHGNVWEWCQDKCDWKEKAANDLLRVCRGGSWGSHAALCRSSARRSNNQTYKDSGLGFRLAAGIRD